MPLLRLLALAEGGLQAVTFASQAGWLPMTLCLLGKVPVRSVSLGILGAQAGLFSTDPFLWTVSLQAAKKKKF